jgi:hypothetical protein
MNIAALEKQIQKLEKARAKLFARAEARSKKELLRLPRLVGLKTVAELIEALRAVAGSKRGRKPGNVKTAKKRKRAVITNTIRAEVKKLVGAGKTGGQIAKSLGISLPSVQNIKKALGLVKGRR